MAYTRSEFVNKYGQYIIKATRGTGILPGTLVAQAILESSGTYNGKWLVGGSGLSRNANNYFGIKCHSTWKGKRYNANTNEQTSSGQVYVDPNACFRKYDSVKDSIDDYIKFLKENDRYASHGVFKAKTVKEQAQALKNAGYATAVNYAATVYEVYLSIASSLQKIQEKIKAHQKNVLIGSISLLVVAIGVGIVFLNKKSKLT